MRTKKPKTEDEYKAVKRYLLECPHVRSDHPAIKAALEGVNKEQARQERDLKLQMKFAQVSKQTTTTSPTSSISDDVVVVASTSTAFPDEIMESDWQDVADTTKTGGDEDDGTSFLGRELAKIAIEAISSHKVKVKSPVTSIALVIHASMRSDLLEFACTGIPEDETKNKGFAAPVRELPKSQFLPPGWDASNNSVTLRYRKNGTGATKLLVSQVEEDTTNKIQVQLIPASSKEPPTQTLTFSIKDHINLDSWSAALKSSPNVTPSLHYKFLPLLLTNFCRTYDLGSVMEEETMPPYVDNTIPVASLPSGSNSNATPIFKSDFVIPTVPNVPDIANTGRIDKPWQDGRGVPATLDQAFPMNYRHFPGGDFADDLNPGGLRDPLRMTGRDRMGGNLMGPGHPQFMGGGPAGGMMGGPGSMQPRFDPMHPPGIDIGNDANPRRTNRPSRTGEPNPDHLPPPNSFGGNMYM
jgi:hypothetical protein